MNSWKKTRLGDLISIKGGFAYKGEFIGRGSSILLGMGCVSFKEKFLYSGGRSYEGPCPDTYLVKPGELVLATRQQSDNLPILGLPALVPNDYVGRKVIVGANLYRVVNASNVDNRFLYWLLQTPSYRSHISACSKGTTVRMITKDAVETFEFLCPPKNERIAIVGTIGSLDDKIELLHRQNQTLEKMMEIYFQTWILDDATHQWERGTTYTLGQLIDSVSVTHPLDTNQVVFLNTSDIYGGFVENRNYTAVVGLPGQAKKSIKKRDILYSEIRPANKRFAFVDFEASDYVVSTKLMVLRAKESFNAAIIYFYLTHPLTIQWLQMIAETRSGTFPQITFDQVKTLKINLPSGEILKRVSDWSESILSKLQANYSQIRTLEQLRDTLLPKLMSGEVRVSTNQNELQPA